VAAPSPGPLRAWLLAARFRTLPASLAPVLVGTAIAAGQGALRPGVAATCLAAALLLQLASNFVNDAADFERGADHGARVGPPRAAQSGWLTPRALRTGALLALGLAAVLGLGLVLIGGWPIALAGAAALLAAWAYTGGPWPLGYHGLGDPLVFVFFGLCAVAGTAFLQTGSLDSTVLASAAPIGLLATAILAVNNLRDLATDRAAGKRTLAVRLGERGARHYTTALVWGAYASLPVLGFAGAPLLAALAPLVTLPLALPVLRALRRERGVALNPVLGATARLELAFAAALAAGWVLGSPT
jgi:1,4-dihydroxy-2-naphthoate octaprenyltransferase